MSLFEDLFEVFEGKRRKGYHGGHYDKHNIHHDKHLYDNHHDHCEHEDYQVNPSLYKNRERLSCPQCSVAVGPEAKFCHSCGASLNSYKNCPGCGSRMQVDSVFCSNCGRKANGSGIERTK